MASRALSFGRRVYKLLAAIIDSYVNDEEREELRDEDYFQWFQTKSSRQLFMNYRYHRNCLPIMKSEAQKDICRNPCSYKMHCGSVVSDGW